MTRQAPTLEDVAREAGVSRATVSRVVNGIRNVAPDIQDAVREAIERTGYAPNRAARALVTRRAETIALVVSGAGGESEQEQSAFASRMLTDPFFGRVVGGVITFLRPRSMYPVLMFAETAEARRQVVSYLRQGSADGALVFSTHAADPLPTLLADADLPCALFARPPAGTAVSHVDVDHREGGRLAADRLAARGCRRVATVTGPLDLPAARDRLDGFQTAMARHGQPVVPVREGDFTAAGGAAAMHWLLAEHPDTDGVFAANDLMAIGVMEAAGETGRRVPDDVAVIGFDDSGVAAAGRPPLTTVRQPMEEMAATMARLLQEQIEGTRTTPASVVFDAELVVRASA
ncbi:LacI family transcriptional regulator [Streptomyces solincola]|uniref:LacI family transcriptional regulator n=1 Tax=Streptomyces solincola TaxID=2100817 RepID=A0A2S9PZ62_9ACTN|nr:LacI family DNA-binding transcriptional regulator [Streptomyces solincola]PRH79688.1 LacI family transcriptional regulator [Streptomyces solincola]